jgi:hypothetical protein
MSMAVLHDQVELALLGLADVVDVDDVRVVDAVGRARLAQHPGPEVGLAAQVGADELEGHDPVDEDVAGAVDHPHPAFAQSSLEPIPSRDDLPQHRVGRGTRCCGCSLGHAVSLMPPE